MIMKSDKIKINLWMILEMIIMISLCHLEKLNCDQNFLLTIQTVI
jgi:hypothetical protein